MVRLLQALILSEIDRYCYSRSNHSLTLNSSPLSRPPRQKSLDIKNPKQSEATATSNDKNKTFFLPTSQSHFDNLQDTADEMVTTNHSTVWTKLCHASEIKSELGDSVRQKYIQAVLSKSSSVIRVSMQSSQPGEWIYDNAGR